MTTKREHRIEKKQARFEKRQAKRNLRHAKIAKFFEFKFLRTKRFLAVERHRANVKAGVIATWFAVPVIAFILGCLALGGVIFAGATLAAAWIFAGIIGWVLLPLAGIPLYRVIKAKRKARHLLRAQALEAEKWYHAQVAAKVEQKRRKAHSKADRNRNKALDKHVAGIAKENIKENKKAQKATVRNNIDSTFKVEVKADVKPTDLNVKLK